MTREQLMSEAEIRHPDRERFDRFLAFAESEGIDASSIRGIMQQPRGSLVVVSPTEVARVSERGVFNKRCEIARAPIASIADLDTTTKQTGPHNADIVLSATDHSGKHLFGASWPITSGDNHGSNAASRAGAQRLFALISKAMDAGGSPPRTSIAAASSKAGALMDWAAEVVTASGVTVTPQLVSEHADMIAATVRMFELLPLAGATEFGQLFPGGVPQGRPIETFDAFYDATVARASKDRVAQAVDAVLADSFAGYVNGCRDQYAT